MRMRHIPFSIPDEEGNAAQRILEELKDRLPSCIRYMNAERQGDVIRGTFGYVGPDALLKRTLAAHANAECWSEEL